MIAWNRPWCQIRLSWLQSIILSAPLLARETTSGQDNYYTYHAFPHLCTCFDNQPEERLLAIYQTTSKTQPSSSSWAQCWARMPPWPFGRAVLRMGVFPHIRERCFTLGPEFTMETSLSHWKKKMMIMMMIVQYCHTVAGSHSAATCGALIKAVFLHHGSASDEWRRVTSDSNATRSGRLPNSQSFSPFKNSRYTHVDLVQYCYCHYFQEQGTIKSWFIIRIGRPWHWVGSM